MKDKPIYGVPVERGVIVDVQSAGCTVRSYGRPGVITPPLPAIRQSTLHSGDQVYFVLYEDGTGKILGKFINENDGGGENAVTGVKGNAESNYRTGDVNLTPTNIGAAAASHTHAASDIQDYPTDGTKYLAGDGTWTTPADTNTTYEFDTGDNDGCFKVTSSDHSFDAEIAIKGLKSAAYTDSTDYATSGHGHSNASSSAAGFMSTTDKSKLDAVGTYGNTSGSPNVASASNATLCSIANLPAGVYVVEATCRFANNTTGRRGLRIDTSASSAESATQHTTVVPAASGYTIVNTAAVLSFSGTTTIYARVYQNSGSQLATSGYMYYVRIK